MAMGKRKSVEQPLFLTCNDLPHSEGHPFYVVVNRVLAESEFDRYVESACQKFYAQTMGRPSVAPGMYFRMLLIGYFEGLDSEHISLEPVEVIKTAEAIHLRFRVVK